MSDPEREPQLPKVEQIDLLALVTEEVLDPHHLQRWREFSRENPELAREVIKRAYFDSIELSGQEPTTMDLQKTIVNSVSFAISALRTAALRHKQEAEQTPGLKTRQSKLPTDDAGDADPQPSV